jgi:hypothetical protein
MLAQLDHQNLIVVHYRPYHGGKFFINCLSHHAKIMPMLSAQQRGDLTNKIQHIHNSIPPVTELNQWTRYELGCKTFWGGNLHDITSKSVPINPGALDLLGSYRCFIVNHVCDPDFVQKMQKQLPRAKHIVLTNAGRFVQISVAKKMPGPDVDAWLQRNNLDQSAYMESPQQVFDSSVFEVNVDQCYFDQSKLTQRIGDCLIWLKLEPVLDPAVAKFIDQYRRLHDLQ